MEACTPGDSVALCNSIMGNVELRVTIVRATIGTHILHCPVAYIFVDAQLMTCGGWYAWRQCSLMEVYYG